jgi:aspartate/methionine/tyrosine aminotransferase
MMKREKIDVVDFSVGEPDFPTPQNIKDAAKRAIDSNYTKYTANEGIIELRQAIVKKLKEDNQLDYALNQIIVSAGAKQCLLNVILSLVNAGDEVIIPAPYWVSYPEMVILAEGKPVFIPTSEENGFKLTPEQLQQNISASTRALILCSPSNPTGATYNRSELEALAEVISKEDIWVIADEVYEKLVYEDFRFTSIATISSKLKEKTIVVNGVSKTYSMTGWRLGYAAGDREIIEGAGKIQSHSTSNPSSISQYAGLEALNGPQFEVPRMRTEFEKRRNYVLYKLSTIPGVSCVKPEGAFYVFPNLSSYFGKEYAGTTIRNSYGLAYYLLKEAMVTLVPGAAFGSDNHVRISYATSMSNLEKGLQRMAAALAQLKTPLKVKRIQLANTQTRVRKKVPVESNLNAEKREALVAEAEAQLKYENYYEWNANINGLVIQLRTNSRHLYDFWMENWYPSQLEADLEPHGIIYAVDGAVGRESYGFYSSETSTGILFNTDLYSSLRSLALAMVTDIGERSFDLHAIRGMTGDYQGSGFALMGPKGTKKNDLYFELLRSDQVAWHSTDLAFARYGGGIAAADLPERKLYLMTSTSALYDKLVPLLERSKCENVVISKEDCKKSTCPEAEECLLDKGYPYCFHASQESYALVDPYWLGGMRKHVKRIDLRVVFILRNEPVGEIIKVLDAAEAIQILENGFSKDSGNQPFFNPHLILKTPERLLVQRRLFERLFQSAKCFLVNTGKAPADEIGHQITQVIQKG